VPNRLGVVEVYSKFGNTFLGVLHLKQDESYLEMTERLAQQASTWMPFGKLPHKYLKVEMCDQFEACKVKDSKSQPCESKDCKNKTGKDETNKAGVGIVGVGKDETNKVEAIEAKLAYKALVYWDVKSALKQLRGVHSPSTGKMYDERTNKLRLGLRKTCLAAEVCVYRDVNDLTVQGRGPGGWGGQTQGPAKLKPSYGLDLTYLPCLESLALDAVTVTILGFPPGLESLTIRHAVVSTHTTDSPSIRRVKASHSHIDVKVLAKLSGLRRLYLTRTDTHFDALFFDALQKMTQLEDLTLEDIEDTIAKEPLRLTNLASCLYKLGKMHSLSLHGINLHGKIPSELRKLGLTKLYLSGNHLTGTIPSELGSNLQSVSFQSNKLSGHIPTQLGNIATLEDLILGYNQLSGSIPTQLGKLVALEDLELRNNQLVGSIPTELGMLSSLADLNVENNQFTGSIPTQLGMLTSLECLNLSYNQLSGKVPSELGRLVRLRMLSLDHNQLTMTLPSELNSLRNLTCMTIHVNH